MRFLVVIDDLFRRKNCLGVFETADEIVTAVLYAVQDNTIGSPNGRKALRAWTGKAKHGDVLLVEDEDPFTVVALDTKNVPPVVHRLRFTQKDVANMRTLSTGTAFESCASPASEESEDNYHTPNIKSRRRKK